MNKRGRWFMLLGGLLVSGGLTLGCNGSAESATGQPPQTPPATPAAPTVVEAVRHYADLMARNARLATPDSRRYGGVAPTERPAGNASPDYSISLLLAMPTYEVGAFLDQQQRLVDVTIETPRPYEDPNRLAQDVRRPLTPLIRLGELRRAFGPGANATEPEAAGEYYFTYQPASTARKLTIQAFLPFEARADSAAVNRIAIFIAPAP